MKLKTDDTSLITAQQPDAPTPETPDAAQSPRRSLWKTWIADLLLFCFTGIYVELCLHLCVYHKLDRHTIYLILFALQAGVFFSLLTSFLPKILRQIVGVLLVAVQVLFAEVQLVYQCIFGNFMPISQVSMGENVITNFNSQIFYAIFKNLPRIILLLLPLIAEQALSVTIGLADTLMVSSVGEAAVSGVSLVDSFNTLMIQIMSALATGGAVVTSQYIGHQEPKNAKAAAAQILFVLSSFSVLVAAVVIGGRHAILRGIFGSIDADVMTYAETYFLLSALSYPFIGLYNAGAALFRAQGNSKISMMSSLVMNVVNIGGNAVLIYGFKMGVMGAALASLVSRAIACVAVLYLLQRPACPLRVDGLQALAPKARLIQQILRVGIPAGIENGMFQIGKLSVSSLTSTLGTAAIAANAVANTTTTFLNIPANAVGMAALTVVGQCLGAGEKDQAVYYSRRLMLTAYCGAWVMNLSAFFFANRFAVSLFNLSPEAQAMALDIMVWFNIVSLFVWPSSFTLPNILRAAGDARFTMTVSIVSMWAFRVGFCYLCVLAFHGGLLAIWMGMYLDWAFRSLCFFVRFVRGKWLEQQVI